MTSKMLAKYLGSIELMYKTSFMNNIQICRSACVFLNKGLLCSLSLSLSHNCFLVFTNSPFQEA
jgi:hypothetical protein